MRVILDTNILCSALLTPGGPTDQLCRAWRDGRFVLLTSEQQLEEFPRQLPYRQRAGPVCVRVSGQTIVGSRPTVGVCDGIAIVIELR
jgi:predicted nucleic acid-binding protein